MFQQQQWILYNRRERKNIFSLRRERRWMFGAQNAFTMPLNYSLFSPLLLPRYIHLLWGFLRLRFVCNRAARVKYAPIRCLDRRWGSRQNAFEKVPNDQENSKIICDKLSRFSNWKCMQCRLVINFLIDATLVALHCAWEKKCPEGNSQFNCATISLLTNLHYWQH